MNATSEEKLSTAIEDYLKTIYDLTTGGERASTNKIAVELNVKPASVTSMIKKLSAMHPPLVDYQKHRGVMLTREGERAALQIIRRHRLLEKYLHEVMDFNLDEVHQAAHQLEHSISPAFEEQMARALDNPPYDPHGAPIPDRDLNMPSHSTLKLSELRQGQRAVIRRVPDDDAQLLRYLEKMGVIPGTVFEVLEFSPFDKVFSVQLEGRDAPISLGDEITSRVFVEVETDG